MLQSLIEMFISKKKIIAYVSALLIAVVAAVLGMKVQEVKEAIHSGPVIELPKPAAQAIAPPPLPSPVPEKK